MAIEAYCKMVNVDLLQLMTVISYSIRNYFDCNTSFNFVYDWPWLHSVENLALGKEAWQSSQALSFIAKDAVDGHNDTNINRCTRTIPEAWPTWRVDLGDIYHVGYVNITTRNGM